MPAAIYARYSSENQRPESIDDQISACRKLAKQQLIAISEGHIYSDQPSLVPAPIGRLSRRSWPQRNQASSTSSSSTTSRVSPGTTI